MDLKTLPHFFNNRVYTVPDYQRGYSWEPKHVTDLLIDIDNAIKLEKPHYTGTINIHGQSEKVKVGVNNFTNFHIVDGQQRLTTLILIISHLLDLLEKRDSTREDSLEKTKTYLKNKDTYIFRYETDKISDNYFRSAILGLENKTSLSENVYTRNLQKAKKTISDYFKNSDETDTLLQYLNAIEEKLLFNEFIIEDGTEIGVMFETTNNRGAGLSDLEIVKNRLLYLTSKVPSTDDTQSELKELTNLINKKWSHILSNLTLPNRVLSEDTFLSNHWIIYKKWSKDNKAKEEILSKHFTIQQMLKAPQKMAGEIKNYISSLAETSLVWRHLNFPEEVGVFSQISDQNLRNQIVKVLSKLNRLSNSTLRPVLLAYFPILDSNPSFFLSLCELAEIFSFRLFLMNKKRSDTGKNDFYRNCAEFHAKCNDKAIQKRALYFFAWYIEHHGDWKRFELECEELFDSHKKDGFYSWAGLPYFLYEYEESLRLTSSPKLDYAFASQPSKSIEHILPQTLTSYWKETLEEIPRSERKKYIHGIGNLLLISREKNSELKNNDFDVKREEYKIGSFSENKVSKEFTRWGPSQISKRQKQLMAFLKQRWCFSTDFLQLHPGSNNDVLLMDDLDESQYETSE